MLTLSKFFCILRDNWRFENNEKIYIYGDYDVDGITSVSLLYLALSELGGNIHYYIPLRDEGYGLNKDAIQSLKEEEANLVISVDCGINSIEEINLANELGLDFATILRALLRQDPDILMIGEIRDKETAEIAVKASLTGHLVFSTLHSNDSLGCINRLVNLGIDNYLLSLVLQMIVSQRLVRKLCPHCKKEDENYKEKLKSLNLAEENYKDIKFYTSGTCEKCMNTGYIGRIPVFEIIYFDESLKNMLAQKKEIKQNFKTLLENAMDKAKEGLTSLNEIMRQL